MASKRARSAAALCSAFACISSLLAGCTSSSTIGDVRTVSGETPATAPDVPWRPAGEGADKNDYTAACPNFLACKAQQEEDVWCWAACAEMIHKYNKTRDAKLATVTQKDLATRIHGMSDSGGVSVKAASYHEVMAALNPDIPKDELEGARACLKQAADKVAKGGRVSFDVDYQSWIASKTSEYCTVNSDVIVQDVRAGSPVVVVLTQGEGAPVEHANVLWGAGFAVEDSFVAKYGINSIAADWKFNPFTTAARCYAIRWVDLIDPWDGTSVRLSGEDFKKRVTFMISKDRARKILEQEAKLVQVK